MSFKNILCVIFSFLLVLEARANEANLYIGVSTARALIEKSGFENDISFSHMVGYEFGLVYLEAVMAYIGSFKYRRAVDTKIDLIGFSLLVGKRFNLTNGFNICYNPSGYICVSGW